jgi:hypothetical protein
MWATSQTWQQKIHSWRSCKQLEDSRRCREALQEPMPPHGVGREPQQDLYIYAGNHWGMSCTTGLLGLNQQLQGGMHEEEV